MPKNRASKRTHRRSGATIAAIPHHEAGRRTPQKVGYTQEGHRRFIRRIFGFFLVILGIATVASHEVVHLANIQWLPTSGMQDLLTGYPMGGLLVLAGVLVLSKRR
ncbi:hypothetical protein [Amycolatopsis sp. H20-H5]|uniref:hypothetical protein n=1 Tax=Amycolatopsis sp. H20-H5 TaxID=3046309 RepID=UPI002DBB3AFA|nr:hypothetical protein [Amycolatopsis sp. H20-H5]MEC3974395.1 hypothetical protein [Amycolatopsis sp. H20-H5]